MTSASGMQALWHSWGGFALWAALVAAAYVGAQLKHGNWRVSVSAAAAIAGALIAAPFVFTTPVAVLLASQSAVLVFSRRRPGPLWCSFGLKGRRSLWLCPALSAASAILVFGVGIYFTRYPIDQGAARLYMPSELLRVALGAGCSLAGFVSLLYGFWCSLRVAWSCAFGLQPGDRPDGQ
ncbi:hypothetical protein KWH04_17795 [Xanthomonas campestris pv. trichodesmae]|uniref:Transmembrane protein n=2 Tax=Xanthomonas citri TaxID=346 RepID=A0AB33CPK4_XANCI|nr:hypothetical protein [Xanthomonas citri]ASK94681.1 hypothetical protein XcvCFBP7111P_24680 [Xanthomonas citri pv. vignicola]MBV6782460.1 hypothetical protein [Xanthomonas campestris pv. trichodesmae]MBZ3922092.1 hypothetical protein [Xanthomonas campestris pv. trichodesmae]MBZ3926183.1 hypothetical protein [Xanthomonas citri pv. sesbaniae]